ncbi:MAG: hypothetical protein NTZ85_01725 [Bacteroidia bacterium]|nr:hypothetical protein [Bacteroidia bacterium]
MKTNKLILFFLISVLMFLLSCKKVEKFMIVTTGTVTNIQTTSADVSGTITDLGQGATQYGHCWSANPNPTIATGSKTELGTPSLGDFTSNLNSLTPNKIYYVRAYCSRGSTVVYGDEITLTTLAVITTTTVTLSGYSQASSGGTIENGSGAEIIARGICWSINENPTISLATVTSNGTGTGSFTSTLTSLGQSVTYYVRAYATNDGGTSYGNQQTYFHWYPIGK